MRFLTRLILRNSRALILLGVLVTIPCLYWTKQLYSNLRPDVEELLPRQSRSIQDLSEIRRRLQSIDSLGVLIFTDDAAAGKRFQTDLASRLERLPSNITAGVEYRIDKELRFFDERKALFLDVSDLKLIRSFIHDRIEYEKQLYNPVNIFSGINIPEPKLDFPALLGKYSAKAASFSHFPDGYYATPDGTKRAILVYLPADGSGIAGVHRLKKAVEDTVAAVNPAKILPFDSGQIHGRGSEHDRGILRLDGGHRALRRDRLRPGHAVSLDLLPLLACRGMSVRLALHGPVLDVRSLVVPRGLLERQLRLHGFASFGKRNHFRGHATFALSRRKA